LESGGDGQNTSAPSPRAGSGDLWDGLATGQDPAQGLQDSGDDAGELAGAGGQQQLLMAAGLVGGGLVLLMGGALVGLVRRRPALAARRHADR
jgi:hypothetical protein